MGNKEKWRKRLPLVVAIILIGVGFSLMFNSVGAGLMAAGFLELYFVIDKL